MCVSNQRRLPPIFYFSTTRLPSTVASSDAPPASIRLAPSASRGTPHPTGAFSRPTPAPRKPVTCGRYRTGRRLRRQSAPAFPRSHTPPRYTPGPKRRPCHTTSLHLVMALSPLDYRRHPELSPFPNEYIGLRGMTLSCPSTIPATSERCQHHIWPFNQLVSLLKMLSLGGLGDLRSDRTSLLRS
jgi:hypothetical protein